MEITYKNSWEEIQQSLINAGTNEKWRQRARDALEIKSVIESIEQQKRTADLQGGLIKQQERAEIQAKRLGTSTIALAIFTGLLFFSTTVYTYFTYRNVVEARDQLIAIRTQSEAINKLEASIRSIDEIVSNKLIKSLHEVAAAAATAGKPASTSFMEQNKRR
jgi:hypothetical protein